MEYPCAAKEEDHRHGTGTTNDENRKMSYAKNSVMLSSSDGDKNGNDRKEDVGNNHEDEIANLVQVLGTGAGQISDPIRAKRKEQQVLCMLRCTMALLHQQGVVVGHHYNKDDIKNNNNKDDEETNMDALPTLSSSPITLVDFGGGSGHMAIPLALWLPHCRVIVVDLSAKSLQLLHEKAHRRQQQEQQQEQQHPKPHLTHCTLASTCNHNNQTQNKQNGQQPQSTVVSANGSSPPPILIQSSIPNLYTLQGSVETIVHVVPHFDIGLALHLCGEATDITLRTCGEAQAQAMVVCPCCVGKLHKERKNPYIWQATGQNTPTIRYPQSTAFQNVLSLRRREQQQPQSPPNNHDHKDEDGQEKEHDDVEDDWNALAKAADYGDQLPHSSTNEKPNQNDKEQRSVDGQAPTMQGNHNATRRIAKALLETDRRLFLQERYGYQTALTRMYPWTVTPKNDILLAWKTTKKTLTPTAFPAATMPTQILEPKKDPENEEREDLWMTLPNPVALADLQATRHHLLPTSICQSPESNSSFWSQPLDHHHNDKNNNQPNDDDDDRNHEPQYPPPARDDAVDWTAAEEDEVMNQIRQFFNQQPPQVNIAQEVAAAAKQENKRLRRNEFPNTTTPDTRNHNNGTAIDDRLVMLFPTGLGRRRRKLIHYVAGKMKLAHWGVGRKKGEKTVAVARPRQQEQPQQQELSSSV